MAKRMGAIEAVARASEVRIKGGAHNDNRDGGNTVVSGWQPMVDSGWASMALMMIWDINREPARKEDLDHLDSCRKNLGVFKVGIMRRSKILRGLRMVLDENRGGRFGTTQAAHIMRAVSEKRMSEEECDFRIKVVRAHCDGSIDPLIDEEIRSCMNLPIPKEEKDAVRRMFALVKECEEIVKGAEGDNEYLKEYAAIGKNAAILTMSVYHPMSGDEARKDAIIKTLTVIEEAKSRFIQTLGE